MAGQRSRQRRASPDQVLAVVEHDEHVLFGQPRRQCLERALGRGFAQPQGAEEGIRDELRVGQAREVHEEHILGRDQRRSPTDLDRKAGLATTARPYQAYEPVLRQPLADHLDGRGTPDEARQLARQAFHGPSIKGARPARKEGASLGAGETQTLVGCLRCRLRPHH